MSMLRLTMLILVFCSFKLNAAEKGPELGVHASAELVKRWDRDVFPNGRGLPKGQGTPKAGEAVYTRHCLSCHGYEGTGNSADELAGAAHQLTDNPPDKTIGTYWPYATTLFDFTRRSMPLDAPGILTDNEVYAVIAYLLYLNGIIAKDQIMNAHTLAKIKMPNQDGFINICQKDKKHHD